ncbi:MAG: hypothetical protein ACPGVO_16760 [Spirulinaceae cyanobacterium]
MLTLLFPLVLFGFALVNLWLAQRAGQKQTGQDVYRLLAMGSLLVCFVWGCAIAPWSLQLIVLLALLTRCRVGRVSLTTCD